MSLPYHIGNGALADWFHFLQRWSQQFREQIT
jgi:hypothetical protein